MTAGLLARSFPWATFGLGVLSLGAPFLLPEDQILGRAVLGFHASVALLRLIDLATDQRPWSGARKLALVLLLIDVRKINPAPRRFDAPRFLAWLGFLTLAVISSWLAIFRPPQPAPLALRWIAGVVAFYAAFEVVMRSFRAQLDMMGYQSPPLHDHPILARTVQEFWAKRWNRTISDWLHAHCMRPFVRRRRPALGLMAAFGASALVHFWQIFVCLPLRFAINAGGFFLIQGAIVLLERTLRVRRWSALPARLWTLTMVGGLSWMMVEPWLQILEQLVRLFVPG